MPSIRPVTLLVFTHHIDGNIELDVGVLSEGPSVKRLLYGKGRKVSKGDNCLDCSCDLSLHCLSLSACAVSVSLSRSLSVTVFVSVSVSVPVSLSVCVGLCRPVSGCVCLYEWGIEDAVSCKFRLAYPSLGC